MSTPQTAKYRIDLLIGDNPRNWGTIIRKFEWKSMLNGGFVVRCRLIDHGFDLLNSVFTKEHFRTARNDQKPTIIRFRMNWDGGYATPWRTALISDMDARGQAGYGGNFEFIAVDPISFYINSGDCSGSVYHGVIGGDDGVIMQVLNDYVPSTIAGINVVKKVSKTIEAPSMYWLMRQDPKTFIASLIDWSSSLTDKRTHWVVANGEDEKNLYINIEESYTPDLKWPSQAIPGDQPEKLVVRYGGNKSQTPADIGKWEMIHDTFIVALNTKLVTGGISAISGEYIDRISDWDEEFMADNGRPFVNDPNTHNKVNPSFGPDRGYTKPSWMLDRGWTEIVSVPEFSAGDIGIKYGEYIDGRPRQIYMSMLNMVMRIKVTIRGEPRLFNSTDLGRTQITLKWLGIDERNPDKNKFMDGNWLLYGWHHKCLNDWMTDIYLARLDYDAIAIPGHTGI